MDNFDLRKYLAEGRLFENTINQISSRISKLGKEAGISSDDIEEYVDGLESSFEPDAYKNVTDKELLKDLKLAVKNLAEDKLLKEELVDKIKQIKDYNETEDSLNYGEYDITYDRDENLYNVFSKERDSDSSDIPDFESSNPSAIEDFLLKEGEYTYMNDANTEFGPDVLDLDYDKIRHYIANIKGDDFANNFIDGYNDDFYENVVRFFDKNKNPTDEEVINFIDAEIEK